ncbi:MAG: protein phosphatase 2C domain-containing protein [Tannerella sp.]|jgi:protein phosphatase|nr:protein phosphatase 2C domain-containing protein [Tannerella sp.]
MNITIGKPVSISERGPRLNNEDCVYPLSELADMDQNLFIVCDGVGGSEKGEIASSLACESIYTYFSTFNEGEPSGDFINKAVQYTQTRFDEYICANPEAKGMSTTMTLVYIGQSGVTVAHIGDSRVYQFRNGQLVFQTSDHSLVNSWEKSGILTPEEAFYHPRKNIITRAIQESIYPVTADVVQLTDIQPDDYFFMCTDGVTDCIMNDTLSRMFAGNKTTEGIKNSIVDICYVKSRDNYSFYIIPIQNLQKSNNYRQILASFFYIFT